MTKRRKGIYIAFAVLAALCALIGLVYRPLRVVCVLGVAGIAAVVLFDLLCRRQEKRWAGHALKLLALLLASGIAILAMLEIRIVSYGRTDSSRDVSAVVILGAGVNGTEPSLSLRVRLEAALAYLEGRDDIPVLVTGGLGSGASITEAQCMADWLVARGIAPERILLEEEASNTEENISFAQMMLKEHGIDTTDNIAVVTSDYHLYRAHLHWGVPWMVPVAAKLPGAYWPLTLNYYLREAFAVAELAVLGG